MFETFDIGAHKEEENFFGYGDQSSFSLSIEENYMINEKGSSNLKETSDFAIDSQEKEILSLLNHKTTEETNQQLTKKKRVISLEERINKKREINKIASKLCRERKKKEMSRLKMENAELKKKIGILQLKLNEMVCPICQNRDNNKSKNGESHLITEDSAHSSPAQNLKKCVVFITTSLAVIFLLINLFSQDSLDKNSNPSQIIRKLSEKLNKSPDKIKLFDLPTPGRFIKFGDYYSLGYKKEFLSPDKLSFMKEVKPRFFKDSEIKNFSNLTCENCMVDISKANIAHNEKNPLQFSIYLPINKFWSIGSNNYVDFSLENEESFVEVKCLLLSSSVNTIHSNEI